MSDTTATDTIETSSQPTPVASPAVEASPAVLDMQSWDAAYDAAKQKISSTPNEQAPASVEAVPGSSTPAGSDDAATADDGATISAEGTPSLDSTVDAPEHWPEETRKQFADLPPEVKARELEFHKGMQAAFTKGMQGLKQRESELGEIVQLAERYQQGPEAAREVLQRLAQAAQIPVWFEAPPAPETTEAPPEFADAQELAQWARDQALTALERTQREQQAAQQAQMQEMRKREQFREELAVALQHHPDLAQHRDGIMERLEATPGLSVEHAYQLSTWPALRKMAQDGEKAQKELQALRAKEKQTRAAATRPINGQAGVADARAITDPWEMAWHKAQQSLAQRSN